VSSSTKLDLSQNSILANLPKGISQRLLPHLEFADLRYEKVLFEAGGPLRYVYFPQNSVVSMLVSMENGATVEVGMIGHEGMVGIHALFGQKTTEYSAVVQIPDGCLKMKADVLFAEFKRGGVLQDRLLEYTSRFLSQVSQTAACNRVHHLEQRLCRWLLMVRGWVKGDSFPITHEFLSHMLGTPRSEVTLAAGILRKSGFIRYGRGRINILDLKGLQAASCECYQAGVDGFK